MKEYTGWVYEVGYIKAEFGEVDVLVEAKTREEADRLIDEWCDANHCVSSSSPSGAGCKPFLVLRAIMAKKSV